MLDPSQYFTIPFDTWVNDFVRGFLVPNFRPFFRALQVPVNQVLMALDTFLAWVPMLAMTAIFALLAWRIVGRTMALVTIFGFLFVDLIGLWPETMTTLAMILTSVFFCTIIGVPVGILVARSDMLWRIVRPILDVMQTVPSFVYLVPIVMLFGVGMAPGIIATIIFALPPIISWWVSASCSAIFSASSPRTSRSKGSKVPKAASMTASSRCRSASR